MTDSTLETVLRRDRIIVAGALGIIIALAWGYVLWLANDMDMGGMDMTGFRMIPAGMGIMLPDRSYLWPRWGKPGSGKPAPSPPKYDGDTEVDMTAGFRGRSQRFEVASDAPCA